MASFTSEKDSVRSVLQRLAAEGVRIQDTARQQSDSEAAMAAFPYLRPSVGTLTGTPQKFLKLDGTVQMFYQGNGYYVPLCIYLRDDHPASPPVCIITPTAEMMIKPNHRHVDAQGVIYLPYLHEWSRKSNLVEMVQAVASVFTVDPFIFKRPRVAGGPPPYASTTTVPPDFHASRTPVYASKPATVTQPPVRPVPPSPPTIIGKMQPTGGGAKGDEVELGRTKDAAKEVLQTKAKEVLDMDAVLENSFRCPISMEIMQDPVFAADGHTYERNEIERWLQTHGTSPLTNEVLPHKSLVPNHNLRGQIIEYLEAHPSLRPNP